MELTVQSSNYPQNKPDGTVFQVGAAQAAGQDFLTAMKLKISGNANNSDPLFHKYFGGNPCLQTLEEGYKEILDQKLVRIAGLIESLPNS